VPASAADTAAVRVVVLSFNSGPFTGGCPVVGAGPVSNSEDARQARWTDPGGSVNAG
jgi:hypothetical protein